MGDVFSSHSSVGRYWADDNHGCSGVGDDRGLETVGGNNPPTYVWPEAAQNSSLTGVSADPSLNTSNASSLGVRWMANVGSEVLSSPIVAYNTTLGETLVYVATTAGLITAYDQATGLPVWSVNMGGYITSTPLAEGNHLWVAVQDSGRVYKLDAASGATQCSASAPLPTPLYSSPTLATPPGGKPTLYIGEMDTGGAKGGVIAIDEATCHLDFTSNPVPGPGTSGVWDPISYGVDATGEPLVVFGTANPDESIYAIDAMTGALVWRFSTFLAPGDYDVGAGITVSAPGVNGIADGMAYGISKYGYVFAVDLTTGALIWRYNFGAESLSTPALSGSNLVFGDDGGVICLNALTGALIWQSSVGSSVHTDGAVAVVGPIGSQIVAYGDLDGTFRTLSLATGTQLYSYQTGSYIVGGVGETDGNLIEASTDGYLYDFAPGGGNLPAPSTAVTSPTPSSTLINPGGTLKIAGTATSTSPIGTVNIFVQRNGAGGGWWDSLSRTWVHEPYPNEAVLSTPDQTTSNWSIAVPTSSAGGGLRVLASAVNSSGVADISAEQSPVTASRASYTIRPSASAAVLTLTSRWVAIDGTLDVSGHGFTPDQSVTLSLNGLRLGAAMADSKGALLAAKFRVPVSDNFGPQTLVATETSTGREATTAPVYVTNVWGQAGEDAAHTGLDPNDLVLRNHLGISGFNYLVPSWSFNAGSAVHGSVDVVDGVVYVADSRGVVDAINVQSGMEKWSSVPARSSDIDTAPAVVGDLVIVGAVNHHMYGLDASTGKVVWTTTLAGAIESSPTSAGADVYLGTDNGDVYSLDAATGKVVWQAKAAGTVKGSPAVDTSRGLVVVGDGTGPCEHSHSGTGAVRWKNTVGGSIKASGSLASDYAYFGSENGYEFALNETTGKIKWKHDVGAPITSPATLSDGEVVVGSGTSLVFLYEGSGLVQTTVQEPGTVVGSAGADDFIALTLANGDVEGVRPVTEDYHAWVTSLPTTLSSGPTLVNGEVFATGSDGTIQCWTVPGSPAV